MRKFITIILLILLLPNIASASYQSWEYTGGDIPDADKEKFFFNLWIYENAHPEEELEIVLSDFSFAGKDIKEGTPDGERTFYWSGYEWSVRDMGTGEPGPNRWSNSEENVWVEDDKLHLKITSHRGKWYCSEVRTVDSPGYGEYTFTVESDLSDLPAGVVFAGFTYLDDDNEIDIEFSKWGDEYNSWNTQYVVQPALKEGNHNYFFTEAAYPSTHLINWQPERVLFASVHGNEPILSSGNLTTTGTSGTDTIKEGSIFFSDYRFYALILIIVFAFVYGFFRHQN